MTMRDTIDIRGTNLPIRDSRWSFIVSRTQAYVRVSNVQPNFNINIRPIWNDQASLLFSRLAEVLPRRMSATHVQKLRIRYPQPAALDDPATYEFEIHSD